MNQKRIRAVFFDIDGTLFSHTKNEISASSKAAIRALQQRAIACVVTTGRHMSELSMVPDNDIDFDGFITLNGQLCLDKQEAVISGKPICGQAKECILSLFEEKKIPIMLVEKDSMYINFLNDYAMYAIKSISTETPRVGAYSGNEIYMAMAYIEKSREAALASQLPDCKITRWNDYGIDIISCHGGKAAGIEDYLRKNHIARQETMAFGDGENDIDMLEFVEIGVAMGNAEQEVKAAADYVTEHIDNDGIEKALKHFKLIAG